MPGWREPLLSFVVMTLNEFGSNAMLLGQEQIHHPDYSIFEKAYIALFGLPVVGLRIRARNIFALIPQDVQYKKILDAGSGPGVLSFELARRFPSASVLGIDLLDEAIDACIRISDKIKRPNVAFKASAIQDLSEQNFFDLIICVDILEHIEDDLAALKCLYSATSPGGILLLHVPSLHRRYPIWKKRLNFDVPTHLRPGYLPEEIALKVTRAGFSIRQHGFTYGFWETLANNISYMITRARKQNKLLYAIVFPALNLMSLMGARARPKKLGAGTYVVAAKEIKD